MKTKVLALFLLAGGALFARTHVFIGFGVGGYGYGPYVAPPPVYYAPPPAYYPPYAAYTAPYPGPGYAWINGYYYPGGSGYLWRPGYWGRQPFAGAVWVAPRYHGGRYYGGYWGRGRHR